MNELTRGAKLRRLAENLPIEFRSNGEDVQFCRFAKCNRPERDQAAKLLLQLAHASDRIAEKVNIFAGRARAGQDIVSHGDGGATEAVFAFKRLDHKASLSRSPKNQPSPGSVRALR